MRNAGPTAWSSRRSPWPVDVRRARKAQIRPIDLGGSSASPLEPKLQAAPPHELDTPPGFEEEQSAKPSKEERTLTRLESWKNRADNARPNRELPSKLKAMAGELTSMLP
jgi:hypothetical protein